MSALSATAAGSVAREGAAGRALEPRLYLDPLVLAREQRAIFSRTWQLAGHVGDLPVPGSYLTAQAGDQPVLVVRDEDGGLRAFRNVCRHRGSRLLAGAGTAKKAIRCRYHGWTYRLDGSLVGVPEARTYEGLDKSCLGLHPARVEAFEGLVFVNLDLDAPALGERLAGLRERLAPYGIADLERFGPYTAGDDGDSPRAHSQPANWKVVVDNYLEGYHVPIAHPGLMRMLDYQRYETELGEDWIWVEAPFRDKPSSTAPSASTGERRIRCPAWGRMRATCGATPSSIRTRRSTSTRTRSTRGRWCRPASPAHATSGASTAIRAAAPSRGSRSG